MFYIDHEHTLRVPLAGLSRPHYLIDLADIYWGIDGGKAPCEADADAFEAAVRSSSWSTALSIGSGLVRLARKYAVFHAPWRKLAKSSRWQDRVFVAVHVVYLPRDLSVQLLIQLLADKSAKVRRGAVDGCFSLDSTDWLEPLKSRLPLEQDDELRCRIRNVIELIESVPIVDGKVRHKHLPIARLRVTQKLDGRLVECSSTGTTGGSIGFLPISRSM